MIGRRAIAPAPLASARHGAALPLPGPSCPLPLDRPPRPPEGRARPPLACPLDRPPRGRHGAAMAARPGTRPRAALPPPLLGVYTERESLAKSSGCRSDRPDKGAMFAERPMNSTPNAFGRRRACDPGRVSGATSAEPWVWIEPALTLGVWPVQNFRYLGSRPRSKFPAAARHVSPTSPRPARAPSSQATAAAARSCPPASACCRRGTGSCRHE